MLVALKTIVKTSWQNTKVDFSVFLFCDLYRRSLIGIEQQHSTVQNREREKKQFLEVVHTKFLFLALELLLLRSMFVDRLLHTAGNYCVCVCDSRNINFSVYFFGSSLVFVWQLIIVVVVVVFCSVISQNWTKLQADLLRISHCLFFSVSH